MKDMEYPDRGKHCQLHHHLPVLLLDTQELQSSKFLPPMGRHALPTIAWCSNPQPPQGDCTYAASEWKLQVIGLGAGQPETGSRLRLVVENSHLSVFFPRPEPQLACHFSSWSVVAEVVGMSTGFLAPSESPHTQTPLRFDSCG